VFSSYIQGATSYEIGENIAWGTGNYGTPRQAMNGWVHDRFGTAWMLHSEALLGIGCVVLALVVLRQINIARVRN